MITTFDGVGTSLQTILAAAGFSAHSVLPERVSAPFAYVAPADPYISRVGATFGSDIVHHYVVLVVGRGVNEKLVADLHEQLGRALDAIDASEDHHVREVEKPGTLTIAGQAHVGVGIAVDTEIHR